MHGGKLRILVLAAMKTCDFAAKFLRIYAAGNREFFAAFNGASFNSGLYRAIELHSVSNWERTIRDTFPALPDPICPFGYDWLGRFFCVQIRCDDSAQQTVLLVCPYSADILVIPVGLVQFHDETLVDQMRPAVEDELYLAFKDHAGIESIPYESCVGLQVPTFLNGKLDVGNMATTDMEVYWELTKQLLIQLQNVPDGTPVAGVTLRRQT